MRTHSTIEFIPVFTSPDGKKAGLDAYDAILDQWPVPYKELTVPTSFGETQVIASGPQNAPVVVLLHALFATAASWYRTVGDLSKVYRTYAIDVIGESNKSRPVRPIKSYEDFLQWFTETMDGLGVNDMYLIGNSYGGLTATFYAMHLPERIRKLVLIGPASTFHSMLPFMINIFIPKAIYLLVPKLPGSSGVMRYSANWMYAGLPRDPFFEPLFYNAMLYSVLINQVFPKVYTREELSQVKAQTLLILGEKEKIYNPKAAARAAQELMPGIEIEMIPNAHHISAIAQPAAVNDCILKFFNRGIIQ
jgi:pimeloyl-ACP methyl ester carboxylesterase